MELTLWTYEGPPHVGAIRIAASMRDVHLVLHAPQGDTYADLLFTMIERDGKRPPVTYTTFQARDLGASTAEKFLGTLQSAYEHHKPKLILVADSCTAELIQDQPGTLAQTAGLPIPVVPLEMAAYSRKVLPSGPRAPRFSIWRLFRAAAEGGGCVTQSQHTRSHQAGISLSR